MVIMEILRVLDCRENQSCALAYCNFYVSDVQLSMLEQHTNTNCKVIDMIKRSAPNQQHYFSVLLLDQSLAVLPALFIFILLLLTGPHN